MREVHLPAAERLPEVSVLAAQGGGGRVAPVSHSGAPLALGCLYVCACLFVAVLSACILYTHMLVCGFAGDAGAAFAFTVVWERFVGVRVAWPMVCLAVSSPCHFIFGEFWALGVFFVHETRKEHVLLRLARLKGRRLDSSKPR